MNILRILWYVVVDAFSTPQADVYLDDKRINDEVRAERRIGLSDDAGYRARVKRRMMEGYACPLPPLYSVPPKRRRRKNVVGFPTKEVLGGKTSQTKS